MAKKLKRFEAFLGNDWKAWTENETTEISLSGKSVVATVIHPELGVFKTHFNLDVLPSYTVA